MATSGGSAVEEDGTCGLFRVQVDAGARYRPVPSSIGAILNEVHWNGDTWYELRQRRLSLSGSQRLLVSVTPTGVPRKVIAPYFGIGEGFVYERRWTCASLRGYGRSPR